MSTKHSISLARVKELTSHYAENKTKILKDEYHGNGTLPTCETFDRAAFDQLLAQEGCVGIRIYYGMDEESNVKLAVVGVDENDQDIRQSASNLRKVKNDDTIDEPVFALSDSLRCPPYCTPPPPPPPPPDEL
jgi:hypothetical protein